MYVREDMEHEYKLEYVADIKKEVVAFANTAGGEIYIGIADDGTVAGIAHPDTVMQQAASAIHDAIRPDIRMFTEIYTREIDGKIVVCIRVQRGTKRPYYLAEKGFRPSGVYIRQGSVSAPASEDMIRQMIQETDGTAFEDCRSFSQDLTFIVAEREFALHQLEFGPSQKQTLGICNEDGLYTNLGLLLSDQCAHSIKVAVFQGTDKQVFRERREFGGSLLHQLRETYEFLDLLNATKATFKGLDRVDERDYPPEAIREALLNTIVHRDYSFSGCTLINLYDDRMELISLGGLVPGLSLDAILIGVSQPRNSKLTQIFYRLRLIESYGTGIGKIISGYQSSGRRPAIDPVDGAFRVVLPNRHNGSIGASEPEHQKIMQRQYERILHMAVKNGGITRKDVEQELHVGISRSVAILKRMTEAGLLRREGAGRSTYYTAK